MQTPIGPALLFIKLIERVGKSPGSSQKIAVFGYSAEQEFVFERAIKFAIQSYTDERGILAPVRPGRNVCPHVGEIQVTRKTDVCYPFLSCEYEAINTK